MHSLAWWPTLLVLAVATFTDLRSRRVPNWLVLPFLLAGIVISPWRHDWEGNSHSFGWHGLGPIGWHGVGQCFAGMGLGLLLYGIPFFMGWTGGGDVKLCAAIGAWIGPAQFIFSIIDTAIAGGIMVLCWVVYRKFLGKLLLSAGDLIVNRKRIGMEREPEAPLNDLMKRHMPYVPAIAVGTLLSFFAQ